MKYLSLFFTLCFFLLLIKETTAQDFKSDLMYLHKYYQQVDVFKMRMHIDVFKSRSDQNPYITRNALVSKSGKIFLYKLDDTEMLMSDQYLIMVLEDQKKLLIQDLKGIDADEKRKSLYTFSLDSIISGYDSVVVKSRTADRVSYIIYTNKRIIQKTILVLDAQSRQLQTLEYYYNQKLFKELNRVVVSFKIYPVSEIDLNDFREDNFIVKKSGGFKPAKKYSDYSLSVISNED